MAFGKKKEPTGPTATEVYEGAVDAYEIATLDGHTDSVPGVVLKKGEYAYLVVHGVGYIEPQRMPTTWQGGNRGVSLHIAKGVTWR